MNYSLLMIIEEKIPEKEYKATRNNFISEKYVYHFSIINYYQKWTKTLGLISWMKGLTFFNDYEIEPKKYK